MTTLIHPDKALVDTNVKQVPLLAPCEHFAGSERFIKKALQIQSEMGPVFDITIDLEDGAPKDREQENLDCAVEMIRSDTNQFNRVGVRIHDFGNEWWKKEAETLMSTVGDKIAYITLPKLYNVDQYSLMTSAINSFATQNNVPMPKLHVIMETQQAWDNLHWIARQGGFMGELEVLDFGLMDFTADFQGVIPRSAMESPGQFDNALVRTAKADLVRLSLLHGIVPAHNVTLDTQSQGRAQEDAERARREFGFLRMWSISPGQIPQIIKGMQSVFEDVDRSGRVLLAAQEASWGPIKFEDKLEDRATYRYHWSMVKQARSTGVELSKEVEERLFSPDGSSVEEIAEITN